MRGPQHGANDRPLPLGCTNAHRRLRAITADAAATAIANTINSEEDIDEAITRFSQYKEVDGLIIIKNKRIGF